MNQPKSRKHGPDKEKQQITVRIDKTLRDEFEDLKAMSKYPTRLTNLIERGLILLLQQHDPDFKLWPNAPVRFLVDNMTREEQAELFDFLIWLKADELREPDAKDRTMRQLIDAHLESLAPYREQALETLRRPRPEKP